MNGRPARNIALSNAFCHKTVSNRQQADMLPEPQHMQQKIYLPSHMQGAGACDAAAGAEFNNGLQHVSHNSATYQPELGAVLDLWAL